MRFDKFTVKAQEAIQAAEQDARQRNHQGLRGATATELVFRSRSPMNAMASESMGKGTE